MNLIKAIIGGLIGAAIGIVLLYLLRGGKIHGFEWFPVVTGLLTGLGAKMLLGSTATSKVGSYLTGAVAAMVAAVAILMADEFVMMVKNKNLDLGPIAKRQNDAELLKPAIVDDRDPKASQTDSDSGDTEVTEGDTDASTDESSESESGDSMTEADDGEESNEVDSSEAGDDSEGQADDETSAADRAAIEAANTPRLTPTAEGTALAKRKKVTGWKQISPYIFSALGVLLAYQLGKTRVVTDAVVSDHEHSEV